MTQLGVRHTIVRLCATSRKAARPCHAKKGLGTMINATTRLVAVLLTLIPLSATAETIRLKLSFFGSDRSQTYLFGIKPFVDAVNAEGKGLVAIDVRPNGALGKLQAQQPQLVLDGIADIAFVVPGVTPYRFPDNVLLEQPGIFRNAREGTLVYTRLVAANALHGYQDFFVIGAYTPDPSFIHSRNPIGSLSALKGQKISASNPIGAEALQRLGATPTVLEVQKLATGISKGTVDGAILSPTGLFQFGVSRVATNHYLLGVGVVPLALVMNRKTFDALPETAKAVIRKYSGEWTAAAWIKSFGIEEKQLLDKLKSDPERKVVEPSPTDRESVRRIYRSMIDAWDAKSARNRQLSTMVERDLATIRSSE
jgi:TRAP-type C4-dicarboxylate transport system substrate-binding protein